MDKAHQKQMNQRKHQRYRKQPPGMYPPFQQAVASKYCHIVHKQIFKQEHICIKYIDLVSPLFSRLFRIFTVIIKQYNFTFCQNRYSKSRKSSLIFDKRCSFLYIKKRFMCFLFKHINLFQMYKLLQQPAYFAGISVVMFSNILSQILFS